MFVASLYVVSKLQSTKKAHWGHSFSTYAQRGKGVKQKRTPCVQGGKGAYTWKYVRKSVPFCACFVIFHMLEAFSVLCCLWRRLSLLFYETFAMIIFLSLKFFSLFIYGIIYWIFKNIPLEIVRGG